MECDTGTYFIIRVNEPTLTPDTRRFLEELRPIGIHFGKDAFLPDANYGDWIAAFQELRHDIAHATKRESLFWGLDHEGGRVHRIPAPLTHLPYPLNWTEHSEAIGKLVGEELRSLGINLLFGPSLDIFSNPQNRVIGPRAFGTNAASVIQRAIPYINAVQQSGVQCVAKHFPGHGDTFQDSHFELPVVECTANELSLRELKPFQSAISSDIQAIMIAHILFPAIDPAFPASLSSHFVQSLLREELGFGGITVSDDLDMKAIANDYPPPLLAERILEVGLDLLIINHHYEAAKLLNESLLSGVSRTNESKLQELHRARRVEAFLQRLPQNDP
ncbi:MAG: glycoside hydrolase family 3 protein, partial [Bdellovibrionales bacterium]|nr:glycoside hydrolase family 3 protein [Bdellovibrionales bacterium]